MQQRNLGCKPTDTEGFVMLAEHVVRNRPVVAVFTNVEQAIATILEGTLVI